MIFTTKTVTCFTLCSITSWCTAAVKSVDSVCAGPVVLAGMTCARVHICFKGKKIKEKVMKIIFNKICIDRNKSNGGQPFLLKTIFPGHSFKGVHYHWWLKVLHNLMSLMLLCRNWKPWKRVHQMCFTIVIKWMTIGKQSN